MSALLLHMAPEFALLSLGLAVMLADLLLAPSASRRGLGLATAAGLALVLALSILLPYSPAPGLAPPMTFAGAFLADGLTRVFTQILLSAAFLTVLFSVGFAGTARLAWQGEYYALLCFSTLGMLFMAAAGDFLTFYVALETAGLGFYALAAWRKGASAWSAEGGLKYLLLSAAATALLLYGVSLVYGATGTLQFSGLSAALAAQAPGPLLLAGMALLAAGFAFKLALVPFHQWAPDVYQAAPTPLSGLLSVGSKAAAFAVVVRVFMAGFGNQPLAIAFWSALFAVLAGLTMLVANLIALRQSDLKRFLAYSSVSQAGYLMLGVLANSALGLSSLAYYLAAYVFTNLAAFGVVIAAWEATGKEDVSALKGMWKTAPLRALVLMLAMLSLAGIPPLAGFFAKFYTFAAAAKAGWYGLVTWVVLNSIVSLFYYLTIVRAMYLEDPDEGAPDQPAPGWPMALGLGVCTAMMLAMGLFPGYFIGWLDTVLR